MDLSDVQGAKITLEFTPSVPTLPVVVYTASLIACSEISKWQTLCSPFGVLYIQITYTLLCLSLLLKYKFVTIFCICQQLRLLFKRPQLSPLLQQWENYLRQQAAEYLKQHNLVHQQPQVFPHHLPLHTSVHHKVSYTSIKSNVYSVHRKVMWFCF